MVPLLPGTGLPGEETVDHVQMAFEYVQHQHAIETLKLCWSHFINYKANSLKTSQLKAMNIALTYNENDTLEKETWRWFVEDMEDNARAKKYERMAKE
ncbi:hypothetical protein TURU_054184 [Turdus rufiventris]|nr:hypothetical protein TURU_054184 [Turdus rufiventris]